MFKAQKWLVFQSNFQQWKLGLNKKQWDRDGREASTKDLACSSVENFLMVGQTYQPSTVFW